MLRNVYTLPQLTVEAKIVFLLMVSHVMICGAVPTTRSVLLRNECSERYVRVYPDHKRAVNAIENNEKSIYANFTIRTYRDLEIEIYSPATRKYLCFNQRWKLIASRSKVNRHCRFRHAIETNGYDRYSSTDNIHMFIGFNENGKPINANRRRRRHGKQKDRCFNFIKRDEKVDVTGHNTRRNHHP